MQKRLYDVGWSDEYECQGCGKDEVTENHRLNHCPSRREVRNQIPEGLGKLEQEREHRRKTGHGKEGITSYLLSGSNWRKSHFVRQKMGI